MIYLDNAATTFPKPNEVYEAMDKINREGAVNAGRGLYKKAREASNIIEETKNKILKLTGLNKTGKVAYTSSATIAMNTILNGIDFANNDIVYVSPYEHNAVMRTLELVRKVKNIQIKEIPLDEKTLEVDIEKTKYLFLKDRPRCVCSIHVSNVTGYILPVNEIFSLAKEVDAITVMDAAQSMGLVEIDLNKIKSDFTVFAGHKTLYGPFGIAGFIDNSQIILNEYIVGGTGSDSLNLNMPKKSPERYESGSINIVAIAGLNAALDTLDVKKIYEHEVEVTEYLISELEKIEGVTLYSPERGNRIGIVSFNLDGYRAEDVGMILDEDFDIAVRTGYHCAPLIHKYLKDDIFLGTVRVGVSRFTSENEIVSFSNAVNDLIS